MNNGDNIYEYPLRVRYGEAGRNGQASLTSLANWMQEAAGLSALSLGFGDEVLMSMGLTWILSRQILRIQRLPRPGEALRVRTWPSTLDRFGHRGYEVYDEADSLLVSGGSAWSVMDLATRKLAAVPEELARAYPEKPRPCEDFLCRVLPRLAGEPDAEAPLRVRREDLDINGHVNNAHYFSWLLEPLPARPGKPQTPLLMDITFRAECFPGDTLISACAKEEVGGEGDAQTGARWRLTHAILKEHDGRRDDVCRAVTLWRDDPLA